MLDIWPPLPIFIWANGSKRSIPDVDIDNIVALLKHNDRICQIDFHRVPKLLLEIFSAALMHESFPALTNLRLASRPSEMDFVVRPGPFSGGSAPLLQHFTLEGVPFQVPELSNFLSSSVNHLTWLILQNIPHSGYIAPEAMVTCISALISLEVLCLEFQSSSFLPDRESRLPHLPTRSVQPALLAFRFTGASEYLEDFVARIDAPQLDHLDITFYDETIFDPSQLVQFICRNASLKAPDEARVEFLLGTVAFTLSSQTRGPGGLSVEIFCAGSDWELSTMVQFCASFSRPFSSVESLYIHHGGLNRRDLYDIKSADQEWSDFLRPFTAVKDIYLSKTSAQQFSYLLQHSEEGRLTEVLPTLQNIFLEEISRSRGIQAGFLRFVDARELSGHPIAISNKRRF